MSSVWSQRKSSNDETGCSDRNSHHITSKRVKSDKVVSMIKKLLDEPLKENCKRLEIEYDFPGGCLHVQKSFWQNITSVAVIKFPIVLAIMYQSK